jgi:hypothetical protein
MAKAIHFAKRPKKQIAVYRVEDREASSETSGKPIISPVEAQTSQNKAIRLITHSLR